MYDLTGFERYEGIVVHGDKRGRVLGFPTANIALPPTLAAPVDGVYCGLIRLPHLASQHEATISVGKNPTFGDVTTTRVEAYIHDFDALIYGQRVELFIVRQLREMQLFGTIDELIAQTRHDVDASRQLLRTIRM
jgi:riboflavin kinase/FMN adenylyltransferase